MGKPVIVVGSLNLDLVVTAERFAGPGETLMGKTFRMVAGGKGANQAAAAARLGYATQLFGRVGDDQFATLLREALTAAGVDMGGVETAPSSTGVALITTVDSGQNSIMVVSGANWTVRPADIDRWSEAIGAAGMVLGQLEIPPDAVERLGEVCAEAQVPLMLDPAPAHPLSAQLLRHVAWLTPNESEVFTLTGREITEAGEPELRAVAESFLDAGVGGVVLKLGARGAYLAYGREFRWVPTLPVQPVDTTAAGDAFNGAFAVGLLRLGDPVAAAHMACAAAALSTTKCGAMPSMAREAEVQELMGAIRT